MLSTATLTHSDGSVANNWTAYYRAVVRDSRKRHITTAAPLYHFIKEGLLHAPKWTCVITLPPFVHIPHHCTPPANALCSYSNGTWQFSSTSKVRKQESKDEAACRVLEIARWHIVFNAVMQSLAILYDSKPDNRPQGPREIEFSIPKMLAWCPMDTVNRLLVLADQPPAIYMLERRHNGATGWVCGLTISLRDCLSSLQNLGDNSSTTMAKSAASSAACPVSSFGVADRNISSSGGNSGIVISDVKRAPCTYTVEGTGLTRTAACLAVATSLVALLRPFVSSACAHILFPCN